MSMQSDGAIEAVVQAMSKRINADIDTNADKPDVVRALKSLGRFALTQFDMTYPDWAKEFEKLFAE